MVVGTVHTLMYTCTQWLHDMAQATHAAHHGMVGCCLARLAPGEHHAQHQQAQEQGGEAQADPHPQPDALAAVPGVVGAADSGGRPAQALVK